MGVGILRAKVIVWVLAACGCGLAGAVYNLPLLRVQPDAAFTVNWSAFMIFIVVIGGLGTIEGPILGTIVAVWTWSGIWGAVAGRFDLRLFPVQCRV